MTPQRLGHCIDVVVLAGWSNSDEGEANRNWICNVETGEVWDPLEGCGIEALGSFHGIGFAEDLSHARVRAGNSVMGSPYLVDLERKTCTPLDQLFGVEIDANTFSSYEVSFADNDTVLLAMVPTWRPEPTSVWAYHIPSGTVTPTVSNEKNLQSICTDSNGYPESGSSG